MGFPSPAADYVEKTLTINSLCGIDSNCSIAKTADGYAVVDKSFKPSQGRLVLIEYQGETKFARVDRGCLVTNEGAIRGEALDDAKVFGVVTFLINQAYFPDDATPF